MIDTPYMPTDALKWRDSIAQKGEIGYIINTHHHFDHTAGNYFFPGPVVSHDLGREMLSASLSRVAASDRSRDAAKAGMGKEDYIRSLVREVDPEGVSLLDERYYLKLPSITFSEQLHLHKGEHSFELIYQPGHTLDHIGVYLPREKVFFAGDNFTSDSQPSLAQCYPLKWIEVLKKIETMDIEVIVPGHGKACGLSKVREFRSFIEEYVESVREAIRKGMSKGEAADRISFEERYPAVHPGAEMQRMNVLRLYEMLSS
jgi:cyclase